MDSYVLLRKCEIREFSCDCFSDLLSQSSTDQWNKLFKCSEKKNLNNDSEICITYIYEDKNLKEKCLFIDDVQKILINKINWI